MYFSLVSEANSAQNPQSVVMTENFKPEKHLQKSYKLYTHNSIQVGTDNTHKCSF